MIQINVSFLDEEGKRILGALYADYVKVASKL